MLTDKKQENRMTTRLKAMALSLLVSLTVACASGGGYYAVAKYGADVTRIGNQAQDLVIAADKNGLQPNKDLTAKAMAAFRDLGGALNKLADGLTLYDSLQPNEREAQATKITGLMDESRRLTRVVMLFTGGNEALGNQLLAMFDNLDKLFVEIQAGLRPAAGGAR